MNTYSKAFVQALPKIGINKNQLFATVYGKKSFIGRVVEFLDINTRNVEKTGEIIGYQELPLVLEEGVMQPMTRLGPLVIKFKSADGKQFELENTPDAYIDTLYNVCSDAGCNIMGGVSRKKKTRGRRRKTKNND